MIFTGKVLLSLLAIIYVLKRVSLSDITDIIHRSNTIFLVIALIIFTLSKLASAARSLLIFNQYSIPLSGWENLKLYWSGMFYNLFLPGGIGGDIYKTVIINKAHGDGLKISAGAVFMDRIAGVSALVVLALLCLPLITSFNGIILISFLGILLTIIGFYCIIILFMPKLKEVTGKLLGWSFLVQMFQIISILFILKALGVESNYVEYLFIFLVSSVAAMLPLSIGGIGIRELVFFKFSDYLLLDQRVAITISFTFYLISVLVSSVGAISAIESKRKIKSEAEFAV